MDFWRVVGVLNKRKWLILFSVIVTTALTWGGTCLTGARWEATVIFKAPTTRAVLGSTNLPVGPDNSALDGSWGREIARAHATMYDETLHQPEVILPALEASGIRPAPKDIVSRIDFAATSSRVYELKV